MRLTKSLAIKKRERQHEESAMSPFDLPHSPEDQLTVKVRHTYHANNMYTHLLYTHSTSSPHTNKVVKSLKELDSSKTSLEYIWSVPSPPQLLCSYCVRPCIGSCVGDGVLCVW